MTVEPHIAKSLINAGIGPVYHDKSLTDFGPLGVGYHDWVVSNGPSLVMEGGAVTFCGKGQTDHMKMIARAFHLNGAGVRIMSLSQFWTVLDRGGERREDMDDSPVLMLNPAQAGGRGCPLNWWQLDRAETYLRDRVERRQVVLLYWAHDKGMAPDAEGKFNWWSDDFVAWLETPPNRVILRADIEAEGRRTASGGKGTA